MIYIKPSSLPIVAITMGDPVGVGPEIVCKALAHEPLHAICRPLVLGDAAVLSATARSLGISLGIRQVAEPESGVYESGAVNVVSLSRLDPATLEYGRPTRETGQAMADYIFQAIDWAREGRVQAVATGPIHKAALNAAGHAFNGHTEIFAQRTGTDQYVMMLAGEKLRVVLVTIHTALGRVPEMVTREKVATTIRVTHKALQERFGIAQPRLAMAALNPHAGEEGMFGDEETRVIIPALEQMRSRGVLIDGPLPADTLFYYAQNGEWDAVVCCYHDQGLIPFKMLHFDKGVNTTLGLPIIRTSVDHGTAYDIAGTGRAGAESLVSAIEMAAMQARNLGQNQG